MVLLRSLAVLGVVQEPPKAQSAGPVDKIVDRACLLCMAGVPNCALQKDLPSPIFCSSERKRKRAKRWLPQLTARVSSAAHSQFSAPLALLQLLSKATVAPRQATCAPWASIRPTSRAATNRKFQRPSLTTGRLILPRMKRLDIVRWAGRCFVLVSAATRAHTQKFAHALPQDPPPRHLRVDCAIPRLGQRKMDTTVDLASRDVLHVQGTKDRGMKLLRPMDILGGHSVTARSINLFKNLFQIA